MPKVDEDKFIYVLVVEYRISLLFVTRVPDYVFMETFVLCVSVILAKYISHAYCLLATFVQDMAIL